MNEGALDKEMISMINREHYCSEDDECKCYMCIEIKEDEKQYERSKG